jgi:hypothetical protein
LHAARLAIIAAKMANRERAQGENIFISLKIHVFYLFVNIAGMVISNSMLFPRVFLFFGENIIILVNIKEKLP